ncbi:hypothetical protein NC652_019206 [Populus alba x Populus x berolinensis]|nr:hypothetical protein NC652_019206 [Populus alba x Populus x berolinensis]
MGLEMERSKKNQSILMDSYPKWFVDK